MTFWRVFPTHFGESIRRARPVAASLGTKEDVPKSCKSTVIVISKDSHPVAQVKPLGTRFATLFLMKSDTMSIVSHTELVFANRSYIRSKSLLLASCATVIQSVAINLCVSATATVSLLLAAARECVCLSRSAHCEASLCFDPYTTRERQRIWERVKE